MALPVIRQQSIKDKFPLNSVWQTDEGEVVRILSYSGVPFHTPEPDFTTWAYVDVVRYNLWTETWETTGRTDYYELVA